MPWIPMSIFATTTLYKKSQSSYDAFIALVYGFANLLLFSTSTIFHLVSLFYYKRTNFLHSLKTFLTSMSFCNPLIAEFDISFTCVIASLLMRDFSPSNSGFICTWIVWISSFFGSIFQCLIHEQYINHIN
ncbi:unnamed protein product [Protopolystoma xenopodis]|uniref:Uncharacterized protein n=1 Tax=Protopolystoma xenopodis TaxID=117903 RepID=A0A448XMA0_9PLAT|nr:unnamed protein product [Protopolystoma xenopodis]